MSTAPPVRRFRPGIPSCGMWVSCLGAVAFLMTGCTLGPTTEVRYVVVHPGQPCRILSNQTVRGERLDGGGVGALDVGGWVAMPPDHWQVIADILAKDASPALLVPLVPSVPGQ